VRLDDGLGSDSQDTVLDVTHVHEKPTVQYAEEHLRVDGLEDDEYLTMFGQYIVSPRVFDYLQSAVDENARVSTGDFQFTPALERLIKDEGIVGLLVRGHRFDIGTPQSYMHALLNFKGDIPPKHAQPTKPVYYEPIIESPASA
jgi:UTP--glucose-1-phosphate uridylyltransferase